VDEVSPVYPESWRKYSLMPYLELLVLGFILVLARNLVTFQACLNSSIALFRNMLEKVIRAPMSFYEQNTAGEGLNQYVHTVILFMNLQCLFF